MANVELREVRRATGQRVIHGVDLDIGSGGSSSSSDLGLRQGTLLRMIAGLETISGGEIRIGGNRVSDMPPRRRYRDGVSGLRSIRKTVRDNMAFGLKIREFPREEIARRVDDARPRKIDHLLDRLPKAFREDNASASRWAGRSYASPRPSCSTSRCRISTPCCAARCASR
jgi:ABC-type sugar transport system ATPase subunit